MTAVLKMNELNQIQKGTIIFRKDNPIRCIAIIIRGSVLIKTQSIQRIAGAGAIIAAADLFCGQYMGDYTAAEDTFVYPFMMKNESQLEDFLDSNADYRGIVVHSMASELEEYLGGRTELLEFTADIYSRFRSSRQESPKEAFALKSRDEMVANYREYSKVPLDVHKQYYYNSKAMAFYQAAEMAGLIREVLDSSQELAESLDEIYLSETGGHLYDEGIFPPKETLREKFLALEEQEKDVSEERTIVQVEDLEAEMKDSLLKILKFANMDGEKKKEVISLIQAFVAAKDRLSTQDDMRKLKKEITKYFFQIYEACIFRWFSEESVPLAVELFLTYGYMDERLLEGQQIRFLYEMLQKRSSGLSCRIYTMPEWLQAVYQGEKEPSRNSFEQDYRDWLREEKRAGNINEQQEKDLLEDSVKKVSFEIGNMFASNNKIVNGKLSTYVPVLYKDEFYGHLDRMYLTKEKLCEAIVELEKMDFTIFQREVLYTNPELKIEKEYVLKHVYPDVILAPVYGTASSMWQEITGKKRDTPGRFIFPIISENEIEKLVVKAFGRFHWEYCRCEQGAAWNNIQYKSLTSEYMDYIQYYRKNRDLTEEKREKIKAQILKARNNSREVFLIDYELWIYYESKAALKLNKVARLILGAYCPFQKEFREKLQTNAAFEEALMRHQKNFGEKKKEWEMRIKRRENKNLTVPREFYDTYDYYAEN